MSFALFDLFVAPWVCDGRVVDADEIICAEIQEIRGGELGAEVGYHMVGDAESVRDLLHELSGFERTNGVKTPDGEWP